MQKLGNAIVVDTICFGESHGYAVENQTEDAKKGILKGDTNFILELHAKET